jgi:hypothetical protein
MLHLPFSSRVSVVGTEKYNIRRGDILLWSLGRVTPLYHPGIWFVRWLHPDLRGVLKDPPYHVDIATQNYQGGSTQLITATRIELGARVYFRDYFRKKGQWTRLIVLRRKTFTVEASIYNACTMQGKYGDYEGFLTGLDLIFSGGRRDTFRRYSRVDRYTCSSYVAKAFGYGMPHLVLPHDFLSMYDLAKVADYEIEAWEGNFK